MPVSPEVRAAIERAILACEKAGARIREGWPASVRFAEMIDIYTFLLGVFEFSMMPLERQKSTRDELTGRPREELAHQFRRMATKHMKRLAFRALWEKFIESVDVFLLPTAFTTAFPHDHSHPDVRSILLPEGGAQPFWDILAYISPANLTGCPATSLPRGLSKNGLPVDMQVIGPYSRTGQSSIRAPAGE